MISNRYLIITAAMIATALWPVKNSVADDRQYYWSSYERDMFYANSYPDNLARLEKLEATLLKIIETSAASERKPPPGILAEYGYFLYERGQVDAAIEYFEREAGQWPDSRVFMEKIIAAVRPGAAE